MLQSSDIFVDLTGSVFDQSALRKYLDQLTRVGDQSTDSCLVTLAVRSDIEPSGLPPGFRVDADCVHPPAVVLSRAVSRAVAQRHNLVVLLAPLVPSHEVVDALIEALERDPMFGTAQPRFTEDGTDRVWPLPGSTDRDGVTPMPSDLPGFLPDITITPELLAACIVISWTQLTLTEAVDYRYADAGGALLQLLCESRRRGLRNVVVNRALVSSTLHYCELYPKPADADHENLRRRYPDRDLAEAEIARLPQIRLEPLLSAAQCEPAQRRILVDCRDMPPRHTGSTQCMLGFLDGFAALDCAAQIDVVVSPAAAEFHSLFERCARLGGLHHELEGEYFAAMTLSQPWSLESVATLHRHALIVAFSMLDTIAWDVLYPPGGDGLGTVWRFIARHADGLLYNSAYTRERFRTRFPPHNGVVEQVTHHSFLVEEHVHPAAKTEPVSDYVLVFGNEYDHKDIRRTLQLLVDAFPFNRIVAFGLTEEPARGVETIPSGELGDAEVHRLIAGARAMVFPSLYEGFGLPVVEGLAYGRPVLVRRSPLWAEIAGWSRLPGSLIEFDDTPSLTEKLGRLLAGLPNETLPSGTHLTPDATPAGWKDCAVRAIALLNNCLPSADGSRWRDREEALSIAGI